MQAMANNRLHVLILGVSEYPNLPERGQPDTPKALGMTKLTSPAISAFRIYEWLQQVNALNELPLPLGHTSLLLSPSNAELQAFPELVKAKLAGTFQACSLNNVLTAAAHWRDAAANDPNDMTWFYFCGHGVQQSIDDVILLLQDFGQANIGGTLYNAINIGSLSNGMAPSPLRPDIARTQVYFIDACRKRPERFKEIGNATSTQVFDVDLGGMDDRKAPIFFSTISGDEATGFDVSESLFTARLLESLNGAAAKLVETPQGNMKWMVTADRLPEVLKLFSENELIPQTFTVGGLMSGEIILRELSSPPEVDVLIDINPELARQWAKVDVKEVVNLSPMNLPHGGPPFVVRWPAGHYRFEVTISQPPYISPAPVPRLILPPWHRHIGRVQV